MSVMHPLAIVDAASITGLVRRTLYRHSMSVYHTKIEMNEGVTVLGGKRRNADVVRYPHGAPVCEGGRTIHDTGHREYICQFT
jgi:hypothetical protein